MSMARRKKLNVAAHCDFASRLALMHAKAHRLGLYKTGHKLHAAVQEVGWEIAEGMERREGKGGRLSLDTILEPSQ